MHAVDLPPPVEAVRLQLLSQPPAQLRGIDEVLPTLAAVEFERKFKARVSELERLVRSHVAALSAGLTHVENLARAGDQSITLAGLEALSAAALKSIASAKELIEETERHMSRTVSLARASGFAATAKSVSARMLDVATLNHDAHLRIYHRIAALVASLDEEANTYVGKATTADEIDAFFAAL